MSSLVGTSSGKETSSRCTKPVATKLLLIFVFVKNYHTLYFVLFSVCLCSLLSAQTGRRGTASPEPKILRQLPDFIVSDLAFAPKLKALYQRDAARLAMRLLEKEGLVGKMSVELPEQLVKATYNALVAVRMSPLACADTIGRLLYIRTFPDPNVNQLTLIFEHDAEWAKPLKQRADSTGRPSLNLMMRQYKMSLNRVVYLDEEHSGVIFLAKEPLNMAAFSRQLFTEEGIATVEDPHRVVEYDDIALELDNDGWLVTYYCRFGKCLNKCESEYVWRVRVTRQGDVKLLSSSGDNIPVWRLNPDKKRDVPDVLKR